MPSPAEINAYLEQSAARTRMRLPLAKGAALGLPVPTPSASPAEKSSSRALRVQGTKLPTAPAVTATPAVDPAAEPSSGEANALGAQGWSPFTPDADRSS